MLPDKEFLIALLQMDPSWGIGDQFFLYSVLGLYKHPGALST